MPIYEYHCTSCEDEFEVSQKITADPLKECPKCQGVLEKLISQSSFVLKGSGWYQTDYGRKSSKPSSEKDSEGSSSSSCPESGSKPSCSGCPGSAD